MAALQWVASWTLPSTATRRPQTSESPDALQTSASGPSGQNLTPYSTPRAASVALSHSVFFRWGSDRQ
eukprot:5221386-Lingulodinium_polyedra.AAC.1